MRRFAIVILFLWAASAPAQVTRYELGQRLRLMDRAWETATPENRAKAVAPLNKVVPLFLANKHTEASVFLDEARFILRGIAEPSPAERWATSLYVRTASRLVDPASEPLPIHVSASYDTRIDIPASAYVRLSVTQKGGQLQPVVDQEIKSIPFSFFVNGHILGKGDRSVTVQILIGDKLLSESQFMVSVIPAIKLRLDTLNLAERALPATNSTERLTARSLRATLGFLYDRVQFETDYPASRLLQEAEELTRAVAEFRNFYKADRAGEFWLTLLTDPESHVRLFVPEGLRRDRPTPLVVAMHGLGASENMFFDSYGDGAAVKMCKQRGWLMVATRAGGLFDPMPPVGRIVDQLAVHYPVDPRRIYILGHSMGATQTIATVQAHPGKFAAAAALGGGGVVRKPEAVKDLPVFVACGTEDFALPGASALSKALEAAGARVTYKDYRDIEHIVIVQAAMKEMFAFFEGVKKSP